MIAVLGSIVNRSKSRFAALFSGGFRPAGKIGEGESESCIFEDWLEEAEQPIQLRTGPLRSRLDGEAEFVIRKEKRKP